MYGATSTTTADYKTIAKYTGTVASLGEKNMVYEMVFDKPSHEEDDVDVSEIEGDGSIIVSENEGATLSEPTSQDMETKYIRATNTEKADTSLNEMLSLGLIVFVGLWVYCIIVVLIVLLGRDRRGK